MKRQSQYVCPWCGSENFQNKKGIGHSKFCFQCLDCNRYFRLYYGYIIWIFLYTILFLLLAYNILDKSFAIALAYGMILPYILTVIKMPVKRVLMGDKYYPYTPEQTLGIAQITWLRHNKGGLLFPHLTIWNHYILPICFIDEDGTALSQVGYARINRIWFRKEKKITRITDNYRYDPAIMKKFVIFYNKKIVAQGKITSIIEN